MDLCKLTNDIIHGYDLTKKEAISLIEFPLHQLLSHSKMIKDYFCKKAFDFCTIINGKSGKCPEDCRYCAQSGFYHTNTKVFPLLNPETIVKDALFNYQNGIRRYSIVTSGKKAASHEIDKLCFIFNQIKNACDIKLCSSNGLLTYEELLKLKASGVVRYHNNLETSRNYFPNICTTHTYDDKIETVKNAKKAGLEVCCGGIIGLGESQIDRIELAFEIKNLEIMSIPLNLINPIKGTPLENIQKLSESEFLRTAAIFRFINNAAVIRLAGGRNLLEQNGKKAFEYSINGAISGKLLTTYIGDIQNDIKMIEGIGYEIIN